MGIASAYELTARNKYCALLVQHPGELGSYLDQLFSGLQRGQIGGPAGGGLLVALTGPAGAAAGCQHLHPADCECGVAAGPLAEQSSAASKVRSASLWAAWRGCGADLRHVLRFTALFCLVGFFHPGWLL